MVSKHVPCRSRRILALTLRFLRGFRLSFFLHATQPSTPLAPPRPSPAPAPTAAPSKPWHELLRFFACARPPLCAYRSALACAPLSLSLARAREGVSLGAFAAATPACSEKGLFLACCARGTGERSERRERGECSGRAAAGTEREIASVAGTEARRGEESRLVLIGPGHAIFTIRRHGHLATGRRSYLPAYVKIEL